MLTAILISSITGYAQEVVNTDKINQGVSTDYNVISKLDISPRPAGFLLTKATSENGVYNENVMTVSTRVLNEETIMLKKVLIVSTWTYHHM